VGCWLIKRPDLLRWLPETTPEQRIWFYVVNYVHRRDPEFAEWVAQHVSEVPGRTHVIRGNTVADLLDWVRACRDRNDLAARPFVPSSMSLRTATTLSADWHEAIAAFQDSDQGPFPEPWLPAATEGKFEIVPLTSAIDLHHEGVAMHHCAGTYGPGVRAGAVYVYSVRRDGERVATASLCRPHYGGKIFQVEQIRGPCNTPAAKPIVSAVLSWLKAHQPQIPQRPDANEPAGNDRDGRVLYEIPF
jgi:hypothetical protein